MEGFRIAIEEFCASMGIQANFEENQSLQFSFDKKGTLIIEVIHNRLVLFLHREMPLEKEVGMKINALKACNINNGWPFLIRCGMLGSRNIVFSATFYETSITQPMIEAAFSLLCRLHDGIYNES